MRVPVSAVWVAIIICFSSFLPARVSADTALVVHAKDQAAADQVRGVLQEVARRYPHSLEQVKEVTLVNAHDAVQLGHRYSEPTTVVGAYAPKAMVGAGRKNIMFGPYETLSPGRYLIVYRLQELDDIAGGDSCVLDVTFKSGGSLGQTLAQAHPDADEFQKGTWSVIPVEVSLPKESTGVEYKLLPNGHRVALDRVYVFQLGTTATSPVAAAQSSSSAPLEIAVPSSQPSVAPAPAASTPVVAADPDAIERPEFRNKPKPLLKDLTSVTAMMVVVGEDGQANGCTGDIIATIPPQSRSSGRCGIGFALADGDAMMKTALAESVRAVTLRYPKWEPGHIDLSFGEKFVAHGGPSAGIAFGLLQLSCLEGFDIDPKCAVTGDITVDWKVRKVGGVSAKLHGATLDKCLYALIPEDNQTAFTDTGVLYGHAAWWNIQVFSIATLQQAVALARTDRSPKAAEAIQLFAGLQEKFDKSEPATLRDPQTVQTLQHILELTPNHLSARNLLALCQGTAPKTLSSNATLYQLSVIFYPYRVLMHNHTTVDRLTLPPYVTATARKRLGVLRPIANPDLRPLLADVAAFIEAIDGWAARPSVGAAKAMLDRAEKLDAGIAATDSDPNFYERLIREGY